jgi:hypothetical protein
MINSRLVFKSMSAYNFRDCGLIGGLMEKLKDKFDSWTTHINDMEEKLTLLNEYFLVELKEKEDIIVCLQKYMKQFLHSNGTS